MMLVQSNRATFSNHVVTGSDAAVLGAILLPSTGMAVWERSLNSTLFGAVRDALSSDFDALRLKVDVASAREMLGMELVKAGVASTASRALADDVETLANRFAQVMERELLDIRLERVTGDACKKFHSDYVTARLITTYAGRATEWLDEDSTARLAAGVRPNDLVIRSLREGDVALLKGRFWAAERAMVHRSPPIADTGEERLLLVINAEEPPPPVER
jgi:hypothetical protein